MKQLGSLGRFVAKVENTRVEPFPAEELGDRRRKIQSMANANQRVGLHKTPFADAMIDVLLFRRIPSDTGADLIASFFNTDPIVTSSPVWAKEAESALTRTRAQNIPDVEISFPGLKQVHRHLFQDVYDNAGIVRTGVPVWTLPNVDFADHRQIEKRGNEIVAEIKRYGRPGSVGEFAVIAGMMVEGLTWLQAFSRGTSRTLTTFMTLWSQQVGFAIDFNELPAKEWLAIEYQTVLRDYTPLTNLINRQLSLRTYIDIDHQAQARVFAQDVCEWLRYSGGRNA